MWEPLGGGNRDGDTQVYPASDHLREGKAYCCLSGIIWATSARLQGCDCLPLGLWGSGLYRSTGTAMVLRWSPTHIQGSLTPTFTMPCTSRFRCPCLSTSVPVAPPGPSGFRYLHGLGLLDPACLVPELDFFHQINSNWAARRAIRLRHLRGPPGLAGF